MDLRQLRHFSTVVRFGSFSMAAENLRVTQPALSKSLRTLEQSLGVQLLDRGPTGVKVTIFGERLLGYSQLVLSLTDEAIDEIDALRGARRGSLLIGGMAAVLQTLVPDALTRFAATSSDVSVVVHEGLNDVLLNSLYAGKLDIVISVRPMDMLDNDFEWRTIREEPVDIVASRHHPLAGRDDVQIEDLAAFSWVVPPRPEPDRLTLDALFIAASLAKPKIAIETTSVTFLKSMLARTHHLSYLTRSNLHQHESDLVSLRVGKKSWTRTVCAVFRRRGVVRPTVIAFLRELEQAGLKA